MMLELAAVGCLDIDKGQPNPLIVINGALTKSLRAMSVRLRRVGHGR
jgi:hypothetical protein